VQSALLKAQFNDVNQISHAKEKRSLAAVAQKIRKFIKRKKKLRSRNKTKPKRSGNGTRDSYSALVSVHAISTFAIRLGFGILVFLAFFHSTFARKNKGKKKRTLGFAKLNPPTKNK
jgi:hypothetical protein